MIRRQIAAFLHQGLIGLGLAVLEESEGLLQSAYDKLGLGCEGVVAWVNVSYYLKEYVYCTSLTLD